LISFNTVLIKKIRTEYATHPLKATHIKIAMKVTITNKISAIYLIPYEVKRPEENE